MKSLYLWLGSGLVIGGLFLGAALWDAGLLPFGSSSKVDLASLRIDHTDTALTKEGAEIYADNCASCHGSSLEGQPDWRTRRADGTLPAPPHDATGHTWHHADGLIFAITKYGGNYVTKGNPESGMPTFEESLTDRQIIASLAYIKSTWPREVIQRQAWITQQSSNH